MKRRRTSLIFLLTVFVVSIGLASIISAEVCAFEHDFELNRLIDVELDIGTYKNEEIEHTLIKFNRDYSTLYGEFSFEWKVKYETPKDPWKRKLTCEFFDMKGNMLKQSINVFSREEGLTGESHKRSLFLVLGPWGDMENASRFSLKLEQVPSDTIVPLYSPPISSIEARMVDEKGLLLDAKHSAVFWRRVYIDKEQLDELGKENSHEDEKGRLWFDLETNMAWQPFVNISMGNSVTRKNLLPGEYIITAVTAPRQMKLDTNDPTPWGKSEIIHLDGNEKKVVANIEMTGDSSLLLRFLDANEKTPLEDVDVKLFHDSGLDIGHGSHDLQNDKGGLLPFRKMRAGTYWLKAEKRAWQYGQTEYRLPKGRIRIDLAPGEDKEITVLLHAVELSQAEIDKRWPCVVYGIVTDGSGSPLEGVEIFSNSGWGTLYQTGHAVSARNGKYLLRFGPGMRSLNPDASWGWSLQAAHIRAEKPGYSEKNGNCHGRLRMAPNMDDTKAKMKLYGENWQNEEELRMGVIFAGQPYPLDFIMIPLSDPRNH